MYLFVFFTLLLFHSLWGRDNPFSHMLDRFLCWENCESFYEFENYYFAGF